MCKVVSNEYVNNLLILADKLMTGYNKDFNESQTKQSFILPFLEILGYPIYDADLCQLEVPILSNQSNTTKYLDYLLCTDCGLQIIVEAKSLKNKNLENGREQLSNYLKITNYSLGILTNGDLYEVYCKNYCSEVRCIKRFSLKNLSAEDLDFLTYISYDYRLFTDRDISLFDIIKRYCVNVSLLDIYLLKLIYNPLLCYQASLNVSIEDLQKFGVSKEGLLSMLSKGFLDVINNVVYINYNNKAFESFSDEEFYNMFGFQREEFPEEQIRDDYKYPHLENERHLFTEKNLENIYIHTRVYGKKKVFSKKFLLDFIDEDVFMKCCTVRFFIKDTDYKNHYYINFELYDFENSFEFNQFYCSVISEDISKLEIEEVTEDNSLFNDNVFSKYLEKEKSFRSVS